MNYGDEYRMAIEQEFTDSEEDKVKQEAATLEEELRQMKRRERYYFGILGGVILAAGLFAFQTFRADGEPSSLAFDASSYAQPISYAQGVDTGSAGVVSGGGCGSSGGGGGGGCGGSSAATPSASPTGVTSLSTSTGGAAGGGCCGGGSGQKGAVDTAAIAKAGEAFYLQATGSQQKVQAKVTDFGCHIQCDILESGKVIKSYAYRNNTFVEI